MSATSGIGVSQDLTDVWASVVNVQGVRFVIVNINNESLVHTDSIDGSSTLDEDFGLLQTKIQEDAPAYILARLDDGRGWLAISYVPDSAKVRDKMLYASSRASLTKGLGATYFVDTLFATSKADLQPGAYAAHVKNAAAPAPMSAREKEAAAVREAEKQAGAAYGGSGARASPLSAAGMGMKWGPGVEDAIRALGDAAEPTLVVLTVDIPAETLVLASSAACSTAELLRALPGSSPAYAFFAHPVPNVAQTAFIYSCPSGSPVKSRMIYSSNALILANSAKTLLASSGAPLAARKIETADPSELTEAHLRAELGSSATKAPEASAPAPTTGFARPKGPGRKR